MGRPEEVPCLEYCMGVPTDCNRDDVEFPRVFRPSNIRKASSITLYYKQQNKRISMARARARARVTPRTRNRK